MTIVEIPGGMLRAARSSDRPFRSSGSDSLGAQRFLTERPTRKAQREAAGEVFGVIENSLRQHYAKETQLFRRKVLRNFFFRKEK